MARFSRAISAVFVLGLLLAGSTVSGQVGRAESGDPPGSRSPGKPLSLQEQLIDAVGDRVFFSQHEVRLKPEAKAALDSLAAFLDERPELRIGLESHADDFDSRDEDMWISKSRGEIVFRYLVARGIEPWRLVVRNFGHERPALGVHPGDRAPNRRVEFIVLPE